MNGFGKTVEGDDDMAIFDRLPPRFREVVREAPYDLLSADVEHWIKTLCQKIAMERLTAAVARETRRQTKRTWGADHPALVA